VLDVGCGNGVPVARDLAAAGHRITGVDLSDVQIQRARRLVPAATFLRADITSLSFTPGSFDAVVALYSLIHMPLDAQPSLVRSFAQWLVPGGWLLLIAGWTAWTGSQDRWLGGESPMWWSHAGAQTYERWLTDANFDILRGEFVPDDGGGHSLFWGRRRR
jgi:2-polyprenyl-3-methyl-5-hydroxy-6-metoxy-1,4-benzoquinol methylase